MARSGFLAPGVRCALWLAPVAAALLPLPAHSAKPVSKAVAEVPVAEVPADLAEHLAAGEFGPARQLAQSAATPAERDALLAVVAAAQAKAGSQPGALATLGYMHDDRRRAAALGEVSTHQPFRGAAGGLVEPDFDSLMDLVKSTVAPETWADVGGPGDIAPFAGGVWIDSSGEMQRLEKQASTQLVSLLKDAAPPEPGEASPTNARQRSDLRKVSLPRLERALQLRHAAGGSPAEAMRYLAGLQKIQYVLIYPETGDLVLAGPADDWRPNIEGRMVGAESGRPVLQLDDLLVIFRYLREKPSATFGCSITPTRDALARTQEFARESGKNPLKPGRRDAWLAELRGRLGQQTIEVYGIDPRTRVAQVLVEADYRMKLVGMGLEPGTVGVESYLDSIQVAPGEAPPALDVLRWWFSMNYQPLRTTPDLNGFELCGTGVQVLSENEHLSRQGDRLATGKASALNQAFTQSFTDHFAALARKYPVYADMQNLFDLALVAALVEQEQLAARVGWHLLHFGDPAASPVALGTAPQTVATVMNHRIIDDKYILVGVSGGVRIDPWPLVKRAALEQDHYGKLKAEVATGKPPANMPPERWWWD